MPEKKPSKKRETIERTFLEAREISDNKDFIIFDNSLVREHAEAVGFKNQFDAVKHNSQSTLPEKMTREGYFVIHLGKHDGVTKHAFVRGASCNFTGFHRFEKIPEKNWKVWHCEGNLLSRISKSEAQAISTVFHEGIIAHFMLGDSSKRVMMHLGRRAKVTFSARIGSIPEYKANSLQLEADAFFEIPRSKENAIAILATVEGKITRAREFEVRQIYTLMRYLRQGVESEAIPDDTEIHNLLIVHDNLARMMNTPNFKIRVYDYVFRNPDDMSTIELRKARGYHMKLPDNGA